MNKEKEALLKEILNEVEKPRKISPKSIEHFLDRMNPDSEMRAYLFAYFSAETEDECALIRKNRLSSMTKKQQKDFNNRYYQCVQNELDYWKTPQTEAQ